jgi:aminoglycoside 2'-N-acetyltransferase I
VQITPLPPNLSLNPDASPAALRAVRSAPVSFVRSASQDAATALSMVEQRIFPSHELPSDLKWQILSFLRINAPEGFVGKNLWRDWISKEDDHPVHIVLVERGILISHTEVVWKYLEHAGELYKAYGLSGVFTYPTFRGRGFGKQVVEAGTQYIRGSDADLGMFWCQPRLKIFYAQCGWTPMEAATTLIGPKDAPVVSNELLMMLFLSGKGQKGRPALEREPIYFGEDATW